MLEDWLQFGSLFLGAHIFLVVGLKLSDDVGIFIVVVSLKRFQIQFFLVRRWHFGRLLNLFIPLFPLLLSLCRLFSELLTLSLLLG